MSTFLYDKGRENFLKGAISWNSDAIKVLLGDAADYTVNQSTHEFHSSVTGAGIVATSSNFTTKTTTAGVADADDVTFSTVTGDPSEFLVIFQDTGVSATSMLIAYIDSYTGLPVTPNGGNITVSWPSDSNKIFKL